MDMSINPVHLRTLHEIARLQSFSRAAEALHLSQPAVSLHVRQLVVTPFYTDRLVAIAPREWPWRTRRGRGRPPGRGRRRSLTPADLAAEPLILYERGGTIRQVIEGWFKRGRVTPRVAMELGNSEAIKELVCAGLGPSITSWASVRAEVREGELRVIPLSPPLARRLGIIRRRDKPENPALRTLLRALERRAGRRVS